MNPYRDGTTSLPWCSAPFLKKIWWCFSGKYWWLKSGRKVMNKTLFRKIARILILTGGVAAICSLTLNSVSQHAERRKVRGQYIIELAKLSHASHAIKVEDCHQHALENFVSYDEDNNIIRCADRDGNLKELFCKECIESDRKIQEFNRKIKKLSED